MSPRRSAQPRPPETTIFAAMTRLAQQTGAVNLGQGFPDTDGPSEVLDAAVAALRSGDNQYPPGPGTPALRQAIVAHQEEYYGLRWNPDSDVLVTMGATEAIAASLLALIRPGDDVVLFEPYYDSYAAMITMAGGTRRSVPLRFPDLSVDLAALEAAMSERTAAIILNTPHNPTGKVFTVDEITEIGRLAEKYDAVILSDEVYEHLAYAPAQHVPVATVGSLAERTLTFGSGGKTFNTTGWKIGWVTGPADLVQLVTGAKQFLTFAGGTPFQSGIARGLSLPSTFFADLRSSMMERRDLLVAGLERAGFRPSLPQGGYFVLADAAPLGVTDAEDFALRLPVDAGVVAVPTSVFCDDAAACGLTTVMRFAFCKRTDVLEDAVERLVHTYGS